MKNGSIKGDGSVGVQIKKVGRRVDELEGRVASLESWRSTIEAWRTTSDGIEEMRSRVLANVRDQMCVVSEQLDQVRAQVAALLQKPKP